MRCVHMDFHTTSPAIDGIGVKFDKEKFTKTIREANIDLVTVFGKCHHGYTYYPSKVGEMHPGLTFNLLQEEIDAIHAAGAKAPIYLPIGWSKKMLTSIPNGIILITLRVSRNTSGTFLLRINWMSLSPIVLGQRFVLSGTTVGIWRNSRASCVRTLTFPTACFTTSALSTTPARVRLAVPE